MNGQNLWRHLPDELKHLLDALSIGTMLGALFQMLPNIAALLTVIWTAIRIYETTTVQRLLGRVPRTAPSDPTGKDS